MNAQPFVYPCLIAGGVLTTDGTTNEVTLNAGDLIAYAKPGDPGEPMLADPKAWAALGNGIPHVGHFQTMVIDSIANVTSAQWQLRTEVRRALGGFEILDDREMVYSNQGSPPVIVKNPFQADWFNDLTDPADKLQYRLRVTPTAAVFSLANQVAFYLGGVRAPGLGSISAGPDWR